MAQDLYYGRNIHRMSYPDEWTHQNKRWGGVEVEEQTEGANLTNNLRGGHLSFRRQEMERIWRNNSNRGRRIQGMWIIAIIK